MVKRLLALLGLDQKLRAVRVATGEVALAAEDRAQLLKMAWEEEKQRLRLLTLLVVAVMGLTTVAVALLSVAIVVHFWDTPHRIAAAWSVACVWVAVWIGALLWLVSALRTRSVALESAQRELAHDWHWVQSQIGVRPRDPALREPRPASREDLLLRMDRQRERIAQLQHLPKRPASPAAGAAAKAAPPDEALSQTVVRLVREHPIAAAAVAAGVTAALGPKRVVRWAAWLAPILWKMR